MRTRCVLNICQVPTNYFKDVIIFFWIDLGNRLKGLIYRRKEIKKISQVILQIM